MKMKIVLAGILGLSMMACERDFDGNIDLAQSISVRQKKGQVILPAGSFPLKLTVEDKDELELKLITGHKQSIKVKIKSQGSMKLPKKGGETLISGLSTGQSFDIRVQVDYQVDDSRDLFKLEACTASLQRRVCTVLADNRESCVDKTETVPGQQEVRYIERTETRLISADLINRADQAHLAMIDATDYDRSEIVTGRSLCMIQGQRGHGGGIGHIGLR